MKIPYLFIVINFFSVVVFAQSGELDSTFGGDGIVTTAIGSGYDVAHSVATQTDGKIVAAGVSVIGTEYAFSLARYKTDGALDSSFGTDGKVTTLLGSSVDGAQSVAIQTDGKIVVAGTSFFQYGYYPNYTYDVDFALIRYESNGTLDSSFGTNGILITDFDSTWDKANAVLIQPDGKIVEAGFTGANGSNDFALVRYNMNGTPDSSFGVAGKSRVDMYLNDDEITSLTLQPDGKIIAGGFSVFYVNDDFALARFNHNGTIDNTFGTNGIVTTDFESNFDHVRAVAIQPDGKIVAAGFSSKNQNIDFTVARYNSDGTLDTSFGMEGKVITAIVGGNNGDDWATAMALQPDGKIILSGTTQSAVYGSSFDDFALARYNTNGTVDSSFGTDGQVITSVSPYSDFSYSMTLQSDGKIISAGYSPVGPFAYGFTIVRYLSDLNIGIASFSYSQNSVLIYPNPIHKTETLEYTLTKNESLTISLYDVNGKLIRNFIFNEQRAAGTHKETLDIGELTSGNYFLTISNGLQKMLVKMVKQ